MWAWLPGLLASMLVGFAKTVFTQAIFDRVLIDMGWHIVEKTPTRLDDQVWNSISKGIGYGYKPELEGQKDANS